MKLIGHIYLDKGRLEEAELALDEAIEGFNGLDDLSNALGARYQPVRVMRLQGRTGEALDEFHVTLRGYTDAGDKKGRANSLLRLAEIAVSQGKDADAEPYLRKSAQLY